MIMPRLSTPMIAQRTEGASPPTDFSGVVALVIRTPMSLIRSAGWGKVTPLPLRRHQLDQRPYVAEREGKRLPSPGVVARIARNARQVIRHDHAVVTNLFVDAHGLDHIHVAFVGKGFTEIEEAALDISEVNVEHLVPLAEVADDVKNFHARLLQHLGDGPLAEVQAMVGAGSDFDEVLQALYAAQDALDAAESLAPRHPGILWMASQPNLVLLGHRDDALQKVGDVLTAHLCGNAACFGQGWILLGFVIHETVAHGAASPLDRLRAHDAQVAHVVLYGRNPGFARVADHLADVIDLPVALRALPQQDVRIFRLGDVDRTHGQGQYVEPDTEGLHPFPDL